MEPAITITFTLPARNAQQVLEFVRTLQDEVTTASKVETESQDNSTNPNIQVIRFNVLASLLDAKQKTIVEFIVAKEGRFFNDELAGLLQVDDPALTSIYLGQITRKLRKVGTRADGFRGATNWYAKRREAGRTLLVVRPDVLDAMKEAIAPAAQ